MGRFWNGPIGHLPTANVPSPTCIHSSVLSHHDDFNIHVQVTCAHHMESHTNFDTHITMRGHGRNKCPIFQIWGVFHTMKHTHTVLQWKLKPENLEQEWSPHVQHV